jgi:hypothetical protein
MLRGEPQPAGLQREKLPSFLLGSFSAFGLEDFSR